jgi:ATP-dependent DNA helicase RecG
LSVELSGLRVGLVHGRLRARDKGAVMAAFAAGEIDVLVATTVIEVGVDVANATLMVIEHAERFGLAQLHQLRGRVGRGTHDSVCVLLYQQPLSATARARLKIIFEHTDGFEIASQDLRLRGPGEFVGSRQSGCRCCATPTSKLDGELVELAQGDGGDTAACSPRSCRAPPAALARESRGTAESLISNEARFALRGRFEPASKCP